MKTCEDCIYSYLITPDDFHYLVSNERVECRLNPKTILQYAEHWCGQLKEKKVSDFADSEWERSERAKYEQLPAPSTGHSLSQGARGST